MNRTRYALIDIGGMERCPIKSCTAGKVCGVYDTEEEAFQVEGDLWDCSGRQQFHVCAISVRDEGGPNEFSHDRDHQR